MRLLRSIMAIAPLAVALAGCQPAQTPPQSDPAPPTANFHVQAISDYPQLYPDMRAVIPGDLWLERVGHNRRLHFSNTIANLGPGHLQVRGRVVNNQTEAIQELIDDSGVVRAFKSVGFFEYHATHSHFHIEQVARYQLTRSSPTGAAVRQSNKVSFCLMDSVGYLTSRPAARYRTCDTAIQGITRGWADVYHSRLPGQWLDVTGLPAGEYYLTGLIDPTNKFVDANRGNNLAWVKIYLDAKRVTFRVLNTSS